MANFRSSHGADARQRHTTTANGNGRRQRHPPSWEYGDGVETSKRPFCSRGELENLGGGLDL